MPSMKIARRSKSQSKRSRSVAFSDASFSANQSLNQSSGPDGFMAARDERELVDLIRRQLQLIGEDPDREGLLRTPARVSEALQFLTRGYHQNPKTVLNDALFEATSDEMVIVKDIDFYSLCEHHLLPFFGKCHIAYLPTRKIVGLSKLPRLVEVYARRLQVQERLTQQIASTLLDLIHADGVGVIIEAQHLCMMMRGVEKQNSYAITSALLGRFRDDARTRAEFINLVQHRRDNL